MRVITGDQAGLIKFVDVEKGTVAKRVGEVEKKNEVSKMCWVQQNVEDEFYVARKRGVVHRMKASDGSIVAEYGDYRAKFVGLYGTQSHLVTALHTGKVEFRPANIDSGVAGHVFDAGKNLCRMRLNTFNENFFGTGGEENDLKIWDIEKSQTIFSGKNVKNDRYDLKVPIHITDLHFLNEESTKLVISTEYHNIRLYDTKAGRRPQVNLSFGQHPIKTLEPTTDFNYVLATDTIGFIRKIDLRSRLEVGKFKGFAGTVKDVKVHNTLPFMASVGLDRFLRVHHINSKKLLQKLYLKQQMTAILFTSEGLIKEEEVQKGKKQSADQDDEEEDDGEDIDTLLEKVAEVEDDSLKTKKKKSVKDDSNQGTKRQANNFEDTQEVEQKKKKTKKGE